MFVCVFVCVCVCVCVSLCMRACSSCVRQAARSFSCQELQSGVSVLTVVSTRGRERVFLSLVLALSVCMQAERRACRWLLHTVDREGATFRAGQRGSRRRSIFCQDPDHQLQKYAHLQAKTCLHVVGTDAPERRKSSRSIGSQSSSATRPSPAQGSTVASC